MILFDKLSIHKNGKIFMKFRKDITVVYFISLFIFYSIFWIFNHPENTPVISTYLTCIFSPLFVLGLYASGSKFLFRYNWYYILYLLVNIISFFIIVENFTIPNYTFSLVYELGHLVLVNLGGYILGLFISLPFKLLHYEILESKKIFYDENILEIIDKELYPDKYPEIKEVTKPTKPTKNNLKYETYSEIQLQVELSNAIKEERFEDAEIFRNLLERKFRT